MAMSSLGKPVILNEQASKRLIEMLKNPVKPVDKVPKDRIPFIRHHY